MPKAKRLPSGSYRIRFVDPYGQRVSVTKPTAADCNAAYRKAVSEIASGRYVDPALGRITVAAWGRAWLDGARNLGAGGRGMYEDALAHIEAAPIGSVRLGNLSAQDIDGYIATALTTPRPTTKRPLAASTVHRHYRTLNRMLRVAVERGLLARNPAEHVQPPKVPKQERAGLTIDQVDALADALTRPADRPLKRGDPLDSRYRSLIYVAAYGGLRWSELVGLRRRHVDGPTIRVVEQLVRRGREWDRCEPKADSKRTVTLPAFAADELAAHLDTYTAAGADALVFTTRTGKPLRAPSWTGNTFARALRRAGLPHIRPHDLRHTSVSLALDAGARLEVVQARHGHSSIQVTADVYGHRYAGADEAVALALDEAHAQAMRARMKAV
jgi:integrase